MNAHGIIERAELLISQHRAKEAKDLLFEYLADAPHDFDARLMYAYALLETHEREQAEELCNQLIHEQPDDIQVVYLASQIDLEQEKYIRAESRGEHLIELVPFLPIGYRVLARAKLGQKNYDKAKYYIGKALELEPEDLESLNFKIMLDGLDGDPHTDESVEAALELDPNNPYTIANHGYQLLRAGKVNESLKRFKEALALDPENYIAKVGMSEALKSRFWPYHMFFKLTERLVRLSEMGAWKFIIGGYILLRVLRAIAKNNETIAPFVYPLVFLLISLFYLSWILDPIMNLYLLFNPYGKYLLEDDDQKMAQYSGISLIIMVICGVVYFTSEIEVYGLGAFYFFALLIPLGSFLKVKNKSKRKSLSIYVIGSVALGVLGFATRQGLLYGIGFIGIFFYQWVINALLIEGNSRVYD